MILIEKWLSQLTVTALKLREPYLTIYEREAKMLYCEDCEKQVEPTKDNYCSVCGSEYLQSVPEIIVQVSGGMISIVQGDPRVNIELRDYDIDTSTDEEIREHGQEVINDDTGRYVVI